MLIIILTLVYREFVKTAIPGTTEVVTSLLAFFSIGILAVHAFDAYRKRYAPAVRGSSSQPKANAGQWRFWKEKQDSEPVHTCSAPSLLIVAGSRINPQHGY
jgi:hypothetical protein